MNLLDNLNKLNEIGIDTSILGGIGGGSLLGFIGFGIFILFIIYSLIFSNAGILYNAKDMYEDVQSLLKLKNEQLKEFNKEVNLNSNSLNKKIKDIDDDIESKKRYLKKYNKRAYLLFQLQMHLKFISLKFIYNNEERLAYFTFALGIVMLGGGGIVGIINESNVTSAYEENMHILNESEESISKFEILSIVPSLNDGNVKYLVNIKDDGKFVTLKYSGDIKVSESGNNYVYVLNKNDYENVKEKLNVDSLLDRILDKSDFVIDIEVTDELFKNLKNVSMIYE